VGLVLGTISIIVSLFFMGSRAFFLILGGGILVTSFPFVLAAINDTRIKNEKEEMFLEFTRNLVESVKTGTPISKSIINVKDKSYGVLGVHVNKLANQISMGIPISIALSIFAKDINNKTISRTLTLIGQAEKAGGDIGEILESVAEAVSMSDKLKKERKAAISTLVIQGYIIFFVFMIIILIFQFQILPLVSGISSLGEEGIGDVGFGGVGGGEPISGEELSSSFLYLLLIQGFFTGLTIGQLSEGSFKAGIQHSFTLMFFSFMISAVANVIFG
jgi:flagellar protein FlaJ